MLRALLAAAAAVAAHAARLPFLAPHFGDHAVLQSGNATRLWGWSGTPGSNVSVALNGGKVAVVATSADGLWVAPLPYVAASPAAYVVDISSTAGEAASLTDVLFGEVLWCGGQSNMVFTVGMAFGGDAAIATAGDFPGVRLMTVGHAMAPAPQPVAPIGQPWAPASPAVLRGSGDAWSGFSAVCWWYGVGVYTALGNATPVGLVVAAYSSTALQQWMSPDAAGACPTLPPSKGNYNELWYAMLAPLAAVPGGAPLALSPRAPFAWLQSENNLGQADWYRCGLPAFIADMRAKFGLSADASAGMPALFTVVGISSWNSSGTQWDNVPAIRAAQVSAVDGVTVGYAASYDHGDLASPWPGHPRYKQPVGERAAAAALALAYGFGGSDGPVWRGPTYASAAVSSSGGSAVVTVTFAPGSLGTSGKLALNTSLACPAGLAPQACEGFAVQTSDGVWHADARGQVAVGVTADGARLTLTLPQLGAGLTVNATRAMWANWPLASLHNDAGLPVVPWEATPVTPFD
jgi:sialate O-acetylesterase